MPDTAEPTGAPKGNPTSATRNELGSESRARLTRAMDDVSLLIIYISESEKAAKPELIEALTDVHHKFLTDKTLSSVDEATFWNSYSQLAQLCLPATAEGIRYARSWKGSAILRPWSLSPEIVLMTLVTAFVYMVIQVYAVTGKMALDQYLAIRSAAIDPVTAAVQIDARFEFLKIWNGWWQEVTSLLHLLYTPSVANGDTPILQAQAALNSINSYILPGLLGWLGASIQVLRTISARLDENSMRSSRLPVYYARILLGGVMGECVGLFLMPKVLPDAIANMPTLTAAFVFGYSAEVLFSLLDRLVADARNYVARPTAKPGQ